jgi:hypothetical protein
MDTTMRDLQPRFMQLDEIWCFVQKKARRARKGDSPGIGDQWIFVATDPESKLIPAFLVGKRIWAQAPFHRRHCIGF